MSTAPAIARVIPLVRVAPQVSTLDYAIPDGTVVTVGQVVRIPFRSKFIAGVVWGFPKTSPAMKLRELATSTPTLAVTPEQLKLLAWLHEQTLTPLNVIARSMVPLVRTPRRLLTAKMLPAGANVLWHTLDQRQELLRSWCKQITTAKKPTLVVAPNAAYAQSWVQNLPKGSTCFLHGGAAQKSYRTLLTQLARVPCILTSHLGLLAPLPSLGKVVLDVADDEGYFAFDQAPRVDLRRLTFALAQCHHAPVNVLARWENTELHTLLGPARWSSLSNTTATVLVDRSTEPGRERGEYASYAVRKQLSQTRTLWLLHRSGEAGRLVCKDCGASVCCPQCGTAARFTTLGDQGSMWCDQDRASFIVPIACAVCRSANLVTRSPGVGAFGDYLRRTFSSADVATVDAKSVRGDPQHAQHVVATTAIASHLTYRCDAAVVVQADSLLHAGQYRAEELFFAYLAVARQHLVPKGTLYVQTHRPDERALRHLTNPSGSVPAILNDRKALGYPPVATMVVCTPRPRAARAAAEPLTQPIPYPVLKQSSQWIVRCTASERQGCLQYIVANLHPTWMASVDPPRLDTR